MKQLTTDELLASLCEDMLIKLNYNPNDCDGIIYRIGRIDTILYDRSYIYNNGCIALVCWLAIKTINGISKPSLPIFDLIFFSEIHRLQIMTENDLPELTLLALAVS